MNSSSQLSADVNLPGNTIRARYQHERAFVGENSRNSGGSDATKGIKAPVDRNEGALLLFSFSAHGVANHWIAQALHVPSAGVHCYLAGFEAVLSRTM